MLSGTDYEDMLAGNIYMNDPITSFTDSVAINNPSNTIQDFDFNNIATSSNSDYSNVASYTTVGNTVIKHAKCKKSKASNIFVNKAKIELNNTIKKLHLQKSIAEITKFHQNKIKMSKVTKVTAVKLKPGGLTLKNKPILVATTATTTIPTKTTVTTAPEFIVTTKTSEKDVPTTSSTTETVDSVSSSTELPGLPELDSNSDMQNIDKAVKEKSLPILVF